MPVIDEREVYFKKWSSLIKADKISKVLLEASERKIAREKALECVVYISKLAYNDAQNGESCSSPLEDVMRLTEVMCCEVTSQPSLCNLRFITSLYHIAFFFYKKDHLEYLENVVKIVLEVKQRNISTFQCEGSNIYRHFIMLLKKAIPMTVSSEDPTLSQPKVKEILSLLLDLLLVEGEVKNGSTFLQTVLHSSQVVANKNKKLAVMLICQGLQVFSKVSQINDVDSSLTFIFKLYSLLFVSQLDLTGYACALSLVLSYVDINKWKFCKENIDYGECFYLLCQAKMFILSKSEVSTIGKKIQCASEVLGKFQNKTTKKDSVKEACLLMIYFIGHLKDSKTVGSSELLGTYLKPLLEMTMSLYSVLKEFNVDKTYCSFCFNNILLLMSDLGAKKHVMEECLETILKTLTLVLEVNKLMRTENHPKSDSYASSILIRSANLLRSCYLASLGAVAIAVAKPVCKFVCTLPSHILEDPANKVAVDVCFSYLIHALGQEHLIEVLEVAVAWLIVCPQSSNKVFRMWGDVKHNAICAGGSPFLDTTVYTIVNERKSIMEEKWLPCNLSEAELGNLLVNELKVYFSNSSLRGTPVLEASKALESLTTDVLTQVRGVVVALDVTSARSEYAEQRQHYYARSRQLLPALRKQKNKINPVDFNCSLGELLYAQFRFKLLSFRSSCEGEVLRLTALHQSAVPLVPELPEDRTDPDDVCDVTTRYTNLSLDKQQEVLADLLSAVAHWKIACARLTEKIQKAGTENTTYDLRITLKNLQEAALIMKLYCNEVKESELWQLMYSFAQLVGDVGNIVNAVGGMLNTVCADRVAVMGKAIERLNHPDLSMKIKCAFSLEKALFHLSRNEIAEGIKLLKVEIETSKTVSSLLYTYCHIILGLYQKFSGGTTYGEEFPSNGTCHMSFQKAISLLVYLTQEQKWSSLTEASHIQLNLLQVSYHLGEINWSLEQPREARCYLRSQLSLAQKLGLPLRTAKLLVVLAWLDLGTGMMADCAVKLEGLEALLNLQGTAARYSGDGDCSKELSKSDMWDPEFLVHLAGCDCFLCHSTEYHRLVLETLTLRAMFCANNNHLPLALQSFKVAVRVEDFLSNSNDTEVQISSARMWKHYADVLIQSNKCQEALAMNKRALDALPPTHKPPALLQHIHHQRSLLMIPRHKPIKHRIVMDMEETTCCVKTPLNKRGEVPLAFETPLAVISGNITPKLVRPVRKLRLPSAGGEENTPPLPPSPKSKRRIKPLHQVATETPQSTRKLPKVGGKCFRIVDDDGNAVAVSSSKVSSTVKKKTGVRSKDDLVNKGPSIHNKANSENKSKVPGVFKSPEKKSIKKPTTKTIEKPKPNECSLKKSEHSHTYNNKKDMFSFDGMKEEVIKINHTIPKYTYGKSSSRLVNGTKAKVLSGVRPLLRDEDSDCSVVEGTPSPPGVKKTTLIPRRATRSNKN